VICPGAPRLGGAVSQGCRVLVREPWVRPYLERHCVSVYCRAKFLNRALTGGHLRLRYHS
jgi:hypothetical protein